MLDLIFCCVLSGLTSGFLRVYSKNLTNDYQWKIIGTYVNLMFIGPCIIAIVDE